MNKYRRKCLKGFDEHDDEFFESIENKEKFLKVCLRCHSVIIAHPIKKREKENE